MMVVVGRSSEMPYGIIGIGVFSTCRFVPSYRRCCIAAIVIILTEQSGVDVGGGVIVFRNGIQGICVVVFVVIVCGYEEVGCVDVA